MSNYVDIPDGSSRFQRNMGSCCLRATFVCLVTLTVIQSACLILLASAWRYRRLVNIGQPIPTLCLNDADDDLENTDVTLNKADATVNNATYCRNAQDTLRSVVNESVTQLYSNRTEFVYTTAFSHLCESFEDPVPYTRLVGINGSGSRVGKTILLWNQHGQSLTVPDNNYITHMENDGYIFIRRQAGLYVVSSNLVINVSASSLANGTQTFVQYLFVLSATHGTARMIGEQRVNLNGRRRTSSTLKAVYNLDCYDRLHVVTPHFEHVDLSSKDNVFSAHYTRTVSQ